MTTIGIAGVNQYPSTCEGGIPQNGDTRIGDGWGCMARRSEGGGQ